MATQAIQTKTNNLQEEENKTKNLEIIAVLREIIPKHIKKREIGELISCSGQLTEKICKKED